MTLSILNRGKLSPQQVLVGTLEEVEEIETIGMVVQFKSGTILCRWSNQSNVTLAGLASVLHHNAVMNILE